MTTIATKLCLHIIFICVSQLVFHNFDDITDFCKNKSKSNKTGAPCISCRFDGRKSGLLCSFILRKARINIEFHLFKYFLPVCIVETFVVSPVFQDLDPTTKWKQNWKTSSKFIS